MTMWMLTFLTSLMVAMVGAGVQTTTTVTTTLTTTIDPTSCWENGKLYQDGEEIERHSENCFGAWCEDGDVIYWDAACFFGTSPCNGVNVDVPGQCCPDCIETTTSASVRVTTPETTTPPPPKGCYVNETFHEYGSDIPQKDPCKTCTCTKENGVMCTLKSCGPVRCVNPKKKRNQCCPTCPDGPNCWYGINKIKVGEVYSPSPNVECTCPDPYGPLACCRKLPRRKRFLKKQLRRHKWYMNPMLKLYIKKYLIQ